MVVVEGRNLPDADVRAVADGRIFTGQRAIELGMVDAEGDLDDAIKIAAKLGGISGEPRIVRYTHEPTLLDLIPRFGSEGSSIEAQLIRELLGVSTPSLDYLYAGP